VRAFGSLTGVGVGKTPGGRECEDDGGNRRPNGHGFADLSSQLAAELATEFAGVALVRPGEPDRRCTKNRRSRSVEDRGDRSSALRFPLGAVIVSKSSHADGAREAGYDAQRVRNRFNLSVAEVGGQETWQRAVLGLVTVGSDRQRVRSVLEQVLSFIEELHLAEVLGSDLELVDLPYREGSWGDEASDDDEFEPPE
jgi:hypothetical protein